MRRLKKVSLAQEEMFIGLHQAYEISSRNPSECSSLESYNEKRNEYYIYGILEFMNYKGPVKRESCFEAVNFLK